MVTYWRELVMNQLKKCWETVDDMDALRVNVKKLVKLMPKERPEEVIESEQ